MQFDHPEVQAGAQTQTRANSANINKVLLGTNKKLLSVM
jgi:hypothetical protein